MPLAVRADERGWEQTAQTPSASPQAHTPRHARRQARTLRQLVASGCYTSEGLRLPRWLCCSAPDDSKPCCNAIILNLKFQVIISSLAQT